MFFVANIVYVFLDSFNILCIYVQVFSNSYVHVMVLANG